MNGQLYCRTTREKNLYKIHKHPNPDDNNNNVNIVVVIHFFVFAFAARTNGLDTETARARDQSLRAVERGVVGRVANGGGGGGAETANAHAPHGIDLYRRLFRLAFRRDSVPSRRVHRHRRLYADFTPTTTTTPLRPPRPSPPPPPPPFPSARPWLGLTVPDALSTGTRNVLPLLGARSAVGPRAVVSGV